MTLQIEIDVKETEKRCNDFAEIGESKGGWVLNLLERFYSLKEKENAVDIPYDTVTSVKLEKGLLSSTIRFKAPGLMSSIKLGMIDSIYSFEPNRYQSPMKLGQLQILERME